MPNMTVVYYVDSGVSKPIERIYGESKSRTEFFWYITCHIISKYITLYILGEVSCGVGQVPGAREEEGRGGEREGESGLCSDWLAWLCGGGDCGLPTKWARWACVINTVYVISDISECLLSQTYHCIRRMLVIFHAKNFPKSQSQLFLLQTQLLFT